LLAKTTDADASSSYLRNRMSNPIPFAPAKHAEMTAITPSIIPGPSSKINLLSQRHIPGYYGFAKLASIMKNRSLLWRW
jgi:hypothetical protein